MASNETPQNSLDQKFPPPPSTPKQKKNPMPKFYNRNALMLKTAKQVCRTTQPAYTRGTTPIFRLFSPKKNHT